MPRRSRSKNYAYAASLYFRARPPNESAPQRDLRAETRSRWIGRHLELAGISLLLSILIGLPLGIAASRGGAIGQAILAVVGMIQTIPSLALLALLVPVPFLGISAHDRDRRALSLRAPPDRAQHRHRVAGHPARPARLRDRARASNRERGFEKFISRSLRAPSSLASRPAR